jgi:hypothetical protein
LEIDVPFTEEDLERLSHALGPDQDAAQIAVKLARAGATEILALATGKTVPATLAEERAFRIFNLVEQEIRLPDVETLVAAIFKMPTATARRMVNSVVARYSIELQDGITSTIVDMLESATWDRGYERWSITMPPTFLRDRILEVASALPQPDPTRAVGSVWRFPEETYQAVRKEFGLGKKAH